MSHNVLSISHDDLDGYFSSYIVHRAFTIPGNLLTRVVDIRQINTTYRNAPDDINTELEGSYYDEVVVTDLNIKGYEVEALVKHESSIGSLTIIDHHLFDDKVKADLEQAFGERFTLIHEYGKSATKLAFEYYGKVFEMVEDEHLDTVKKYVELVNAWDIHDFSDYSIFQCGQAYNDFFGDILSCFQTTVTRDMLTSVAMTAFDTLVKRGPDLAKLGLGKDGLMPVNLEPLLRLNIVNHFSISDAVSHFEKNNDIDANPAREDKMAALTKEKTKDLAFRQFNSLVAATLTFYDYNPLTVSSRTLKKDGVEFDYRFYAVNRPLPMPIVHHLLYTHQSVDGVFIFRNGRCELRQSGEINPENQIHLGEIASKFGGGGHVCAAGFLFERKNDTHGHLKKKEFIDTVVEMYS